MQPRKRKREQENQDQTCEKPPSKRIHTQGSSIPAYCPPSTLEPSCCNLAGPGSACPDPVRHWTYTYKQPLSTAIQATMSGESKKRGRSYAQSSREGQDPRAHSLDHEKAMVEHGMIMNTLQDEVTVDQESIELCRVLSAARYDPPPDSLFHDATFEAVLQKAQLRGEARIVRDLTPSLVPSAELLHICHKADLPHITEEVNALWDKCNSIFGPRPKPDFSAGMAESAFTQEELEQLKIYQTADTPCKVTVDMYFPFLVAEVKSSERTLAEAERQATQSANIAVRAIIELFRRVSRENELHGKILAVSIVHDHQIARMHGYFAGTRSTKPKFFRRQIRSVDYTDRDSRWTSYNLTRAVYEFIAPKHLERIRSVLAEPEMHKFASFTSVGSTDTNGEESGSQDVATSVQSSQRKKAFRKPSLPSNSMLQGENEMLIRQSKEDKDTIEQLQRRLLELDEDRKAFKERLEKQGEEHKEQLDKVLEMLLRSK